MASTSSASSSTQKESSSISSLPDNRFELELEFVQALASPAYLHFLATSKTEEGDRLLLQEPAFQTYLQYLFQTWTKPEYSRFLSYPHALYFLELLIEKPSIIVKEWTLPQFRNFCHQQQFLAWQHRHSTLYGRGSGGGGLVVPEEQHPATALQKTPEEQQQQMTLDE